MSKVTTLYSSHDELLLDLDIFGTIISEAPMSIGELKELLYQDYKRAHKVSLEDKRYQLSRVVSTDFHIKYTEELVLADDEELVDLLDEGDEDSTVEEDVYRDPTPDEISALEAEVSALQQQYAELERLSDTQLEDAVSNFGATSDVVSDSSIALANMASTEETAEETGVSEGESAENDLGVEVEDTADYSSFGADEDFAEFGAEEDYDEEESFGADEESSYADEEDFDEDESFGSEDAEDYGGVDDSYNDSDIGEPEEDFDEDESFGSAEDEGFEEEDDFGVDEDGSFGDDSDIGEPEEDYDEGFGVEEDDDAFGVEEDVSAQATQNIEQVVAPVENSYSYTAPQQESIPVQSQSRPTGNNRPQQRQRSNVQQGQSQRSENRQKPSQRPAQSGSRQAPQQGGTQRPSQQGRPVQGGQTQQRKPQQPLGRAPKGVPPAPIPRNQAQMQSQQKAVEKVDRAEEPKDLREFLRKYPHCEVNFALKYFSHKEIQKAILTGKIIKKGNKLHL